MTEFRRRLMLGGETPGWNEYPVECWGIGNLSNGNYQTYNNLFYGWFPVLSPQIKIENTSGYNAFCSQYNSNMTRISDMGLTNSGIYTFDSNAAYFSAVLWDKPSLSVVDSGQFKMYYFGFSYKKPTTKPIMTGADYLWATINMNSGNLVTNSGYQNSSTREYQTILPGAMDIDMTQMQYNFTIHLYTYNKSFINYFDARAGQSYTDVLASFPTAQYYRLCCWDKPPATYVRTAPFVITFRQ